MYSVSYTKNASAQLLGRTEISLQNTFVVECDVILTQPGTLHSDLRRDANDSRIVHALEVARGTNTPNRGAISIGNLIVIDGVRHPNHTLNHIEHVARVPVGIVSSRTPWDSARFPSVENTTDAVVHCGAQGESSCM